MKNIFSEDILILENGFGSTEIGAVLTYDGELRDGREHAE